MTLRLILVQEPATAWTAAERVQGGTPVPPLPQALLDLENHSPEFAGEATAIYASDEEPGFSAGLALGRTLRLPRRHRAELRPLDMGAWDGLLWPEIRDRYGRMYRRWRTAPRQFAPPRGETLAEAAARLEPLVTEILDAGRDAIVVASHGILVTLLTEVLPGADEEDADTVWQAYDPAESWLEHEVLTDADD